MKRYKPMILIVLTVLVAFITSFLVYKWLQERTLAIAKQRGDIVNVPVAVVDLGAGMIIRPEMIKTVPFLKKSLQPGSVVDAGALDGRVVIVPIRADEPIFESRLASADIKRGGVAAVIAENKRAMAIKVDKVKGVSGFIHPGNRVDVVATFRPSHLRTPVTMTVLENIPVLATGSDTEVRGKQEKPMEVDVITLEVSPEEAEVLALAAVEGKLQLALRNYSDRTNVASRGTSVSSLVRFLNGREEPAPKKKAPAPRTTTAVKTEPAPAPQPVRDSYVSVQLIEGHKIDEVNFRERGE